MSDHTRITRVSVEMQRELSDIIRSLKDPRIKGVVSITASDVTRDFRHANVRVSIYGVNEEEKKACFQAIETASGYIRREVGHRMALRYTPELHFSLDTSIEYGINMAQLIDSVVKADDASEEE